MRVVYRRGALHNEIANIAYVAADVAMTADNHHRLHQTFDICEGDNLPRIDNLLTLAFTEVYAALSPLLEGSLTGASRGSAGEGRSGGLPGGAPPLVLRFRKGAVSTAVVLRIRETAREYMVCRALHGWLSLTLPESAAMWRERCDVLLPQLAAAARAEAMRVEYMSADSVWTRGRPLSSF